MREVDDDRVIAAGDAATLLEGARVLGVALDATAINRLLQYVQLLKRWNRTFNLVSRKDIDRLVARHLLDSLSVRPWLHGPRVMDLGSGAGLPGIPLAIVCPDRDFTLVDRSKRKTRFLNQVIAELDLANVFVCCQNAKAGEGREEFSTVTARAVAPPQDVWRLVSDRLDVGGRLIMLNRVLSEAAEDAAEYEPVEMVFPGGVVARVQIQIPGLTRTHGVMIVERC